MTTKIFHEIPDVCAEEICGTEDTVSANGDELLGFEDIHAVPTTRSRASSQDSTSGTDGGSRQAKPKSKEDSVGERLRRSTRARTSSQEESGEESGGVPASRGRADSGALLDMLAEVASQKLLFSPVKRKSEKNADGGDEKLSLSQIRGLSTNQMIKLFSTTEFNEMKKLYSFHCAFDSTCEAQFISFGNENRAKEKFKKHLWEHLETLTVKEADLKEAQKRRKVPLLRKGKGRSSFKEIDIIEKTEENNVNWDEALILDNIDKVEVEMVSEATTAPVDLKAVAETSAALDLSKLIAGLSEKMGVSGVAGEHSYSTMEKIKTEDAQETEEEEEEEEVVNVVHPSEELRRFMDIETKDTVMVCVLEGDNVVLKHLPPVGQQVDIESSAGAATEYRVYSPPSVQLTQAEYNVIRSSELPIIADNRSSSPTPSTAFLDPSAVWELNHGGNIERDEFHHARKPKGKAKFIGQSKMEKEMALKAIEAIRRKTGGGGLETLQCTICRPPRSFTAPTTLISHYRSHAGIKPYECKVCGAVFTRQHSLNYHMLIHTNQTRFTCQDCGRKFRHPSHFKEHRRRHTGESPFECSDCLMRFKTRNTYKRHLRTRHGKVLTTSGGLIILSEDEFQMVRTVPRQTVAAVKRGRPRKVMDTLANYDEHSIDAIDEDIQALHQLEIVTSHEGAYEYDKDESMDIDEMPVDFIQDETDDADNGRTNAAYKEIVKEAVRLEKAEQEKKLQQQLKNNNKLNGSVEHSDEETIVIETEDPLTGSGLYLATLEDGQTVLVNADDSQGEMNLGLKVVQMAPGRSKYFITGNAQTEPTVIVIKNEPID